MAPTRRRGTAIVEVEHQGLHGILVVGDGQHWLLPGGGADRPGETRLEAAVRELYEETGLRTLAALHLFDHETSNLHKVFYLRATGTLTIRDPHEIWALGLCREDFSIVPIVTLPDHTLPADLTTGTKAILARWQQYRTERMAFFQSLQRYEYPEHGAEGARRGPTERHSAHRGSPVAPPEVFERLDSLTIQQGSTPRTITIYRGDLSAIPPEEAVDILVVSARPDGYHPSRNSLIGALHRRGVSVEALAADKAEDFRPTLACWLSKPIEGGSPAPQFKRILCFEPKQKGAPAEVIGDIFQCLTSMSSTTPMRSVALSILGSGSQGVSTVEMIAPLFEAATHWFAQGLPIETIKIVAYSEISAAELRGAFNILKRQYRPPAPAPVSPYKYDLFISYCWANKDDVDFLVAELKQQRPGVRIFLDRLELKPGAAWQHEIFSALDECAKIVAVYSPDYLQSKICLFEYNAALVRHRDSNNGVLMPIFLRTVMLPTFMKLTQYIDCRESNRDLLRTAAASILARL